MKKIFVCIAVAVLFTGSIVQAQSTIKSNGVTYSTDAHSTLLAWCMGQDCSVSGLSKDIYKLMYKNDEFFTIGGIKTKGHRACIEQNPGKSGWSIAVDLMAGELKWAGCQTGVLGFGL